MEKVDWQPFITWELGPTFHCQEIEVGHMNLLNKMIINDMLHFPPCPPLSIETRQVKKVQNPKLRKLLKEIHGTGKGGY